MSILKLRGLGKPSSSKSQKPPASSRSCILIVTWMFFSSCGESSLSANDCAANFSNFVSSVFLAPLTLIIIADPLLLLIYLYHFVSSINFQNSSFRISVFVLGPPVGNIVIVVFPCGSISITEIGIGESNSTRPEDFLSFRLLEDREVLLNLCIF